MFNQIEYPPEYYSLSLQMLETSLGKVLMYRSWQPFDPGPGFSVNKRYAALPVLTKKDIRQYFPYGVLPQDIDLQKGLSTGEIELVQTSGTTDDKITNIC